jgi:dCTP deaminase
MGVLTDVQIEKEIKIVPFAPQMKRPGVISYGLSSMGYDLRLGNKYKIFTNLMPGIIDPKADNQHLFHNYEGDHCIIPPHSYVLAESLEYLEIPRDIIVVCVGKSTYARCGIILSVRGLGKLRSKFRITPLYLLRFTQGKEFYSCSFFGVKFPVDLLMKKKVGSIRIN